MSIDILIPLQRMLCKTHTRQTGRLAEATYQASDPARSSCGCAVAGRNHWPSLLPQAETL